jgi:UDP-xylose/UDP-N-acetylglucosamine transporter B4
VRGKRYSKLQVSSVVLLTVGVLVSAWADSMSKVRSSHMSNIDSCQVTLLTIRVIGQIDEG